VQRTLERLWLLGTSMWLFYSGYLVFGGHLTFPSFGATDRPAIFPGAYQVFVFSVVVVPPAVVLGLGAVLHWLLMRFRNANG